jgi:hypothetical protein
MASSNLYHLEEFQMSGDEVGLRKHLRDDHKVAYQDIRVHPAAETWKQHEEFHPAPSPEQAYKMIAYAHRLVRTASQLEANAAAHRDTALRKVLEANWGLRKADIAEVEFDHTAVIKTDEVKAAPFGDDDLDDEDG